MIILTLLFLVTCFLAYSNGANDNFKGVATLFGSKTTSYGRAIWWATITTFAGSVGSLFGIGLVTRQVDFRVIVSIVLSWILTLPVAAILAWVSYWLLKVL
jgi:inorganic phosphate transporter, PiT family